MRSTRCGIPRRSGTLNPYLFLRIALDLICGLTSSRQSEENPCRASVPCAWVLDGAGVRAFRPDAFSGPDRADPYTAYENSSSPRLMKAPYPALFPDRFSHLTVSASAGRHCPDPRRAAAPRNRDRRAWRRNRPKRGETESALEMPVRLPEG